MTSPYEGVASADWPKVTEALIAQHPLKRDELIAAVQESWKLIFTDSVIGGKLRIGIEIFPKPQILGDFLHELVPLVLEENYPKVWRRDQAANERDIVCLTDSRFSIEIKTSSSAKGVFGNRSFSQKSMERPEKKEKSGYYLTINHPPVHKLRKVEPITLIRFGWLDHKDWAGQAAASGQQSSLSPEVLRGKLLTIYPRT